MYVYRNPYLLSGTLQMYPRCTHCGTKYKIEPSFFYGAMYVSYAVGVALAIGTFIITRVFIGTGLKTAFISIVAILILCMPLIMRLSRNIWINLFISYDPGMAERS